MSYRLSKKEMRILIETRNESEKVYENQPGGEKRKYREIKSLLVFVCTFLALILFVYALLWLGSLVGGYEG